MLALALIAVSIVEIDCASLMVGRSLRLTMLALIAVSNAEIDCVSLDGCVNRCD